MSVHNSQYTVNGLDLGSNHQFNPLRQCQLYNHPRTLKQFKLSLSFQNITFNIPIQIIHNFMIDPLFRKESLVNNH